MLINAVTINNIQNLLKEIVNDSYEGVNTTTDLTVDTPTIRNMPLVGIYVNDVSDSFIQPYGRYFSASKKGTYEVYSFRLQCFHRSDSQGEGKTTNVNDLASKIKKFINMNRDKYRDTYYVDDIFEINIRPSLPVEHKVYGMSRVIMEGKLSAKNLDEVN